MMKPYGAVVDKHTVLIADDTPDNLYLISSILTQFYKVKTANNGEKAIRIASGDKAPDIILLDTMMPDMDGYEVCRRLKENPATRDIPIIFLTTITDEAHQEEGFQAGAVDYVTKPVCVPILIARLNTHLKLKAAADFFRDKNAYLEQEIKKRIYEIQSIQDVTILSLTSLAEARDSEIGNHIRRTQLYMKLLATHLKSHPEIGSIFTDTYIDILFKSAPLHDIGKVGISDHILLNPGKLDPEEYEIIKTHTTIGRNAIINAERNLSVKLDFLSLAKEIAYSHHEKWDGSGYPENLIGTDIPISARLMAVVDVYDALISKRVYKPSYSHEQAVEILLEGRGSHFDPVILDAFIEIQDDIKKITDQFEDSPLD